MNVHGGSARTTEKPIADVALLRELMRRASRLVFNATARTAGRCIRWGLDGRSHRAPGANSCRPCRVAQMEVMRSASPGGRLHRDIRDCLLVELGNAGAAPVKRGAHRSGVEGMRGPVRGLAPIDAEELMKLRDHLGRNAEAAGEGGWPSTYWMLSKPVL